MHLLTALVFAVALWLTDANITNTIAMLKGHNLRGYGNPAVLGIVAALMWGLFWYLTHA